MNGSNSKKSIEVCFQCGSRLKCDSYKIYLSGLSVKANTTKKLKMAAVESSNLAAVGYHKDMRILRIKFKNDVVYDYFAVPFDIASDLMLADSVGKCFNATVKGQFDCVNITGLSGV